MTTFNEPMRINGRNYIFEIGRQYDWIYRFMHIKANSGYTEFYLICPLNGPEYLAPTLKKAIKAIDKMHIEEAKAEKAAKDAKNGMRPGKKSAKKATENLKFDFSADDIPF